MELTSERNLVSAIIPTYNRSGLLAEAVQSVITQTYRPIECIIVDDGSTDNTREVVSKIRITDISSFTVKYICFGRFVGYKDQVTKRYRNNALNVLRSLLGPNLNLSLNKFFYRKLFQIVWPN